MTTNRPDLPEFEFSPTTYSVVADLAGNVLGQVQDINPQSQVNTTDVNRLGDPNTHTVTGTKTSSVSINVFAKQNLEPLADFLNYDELPNPGVPVQLRVDAPAKDLEILKFDGTGSDAVLISKQRLIGYRPTQLSTAMAPNNQEIYAISGSLVDWYYVTE